MNTNEFFLKRALQLAETAFEENEIPIGAVIVNNDRIIGKGYNQTEKLHDPTAHAEMIAITAACEFLGDRHLHDCTIYITLEPCLMCAQALKWAQISNIVFGAYDKKEGFQSKHQLSFSKKTKIEGGVLEDYCADLINNFFKEIRNKN